MRRTAVWIMFGVIMGAALSLATGPSEGRLHAPLRSLLPAEDNCTALVLDRVTGLTVAASCHRSGAIRLEARIGDRQRLRT